MENIGMFFFKKSNDRYGRGPGLQRLTCPICGFHNFVQEQEQSAWTYSCVICTHMITFRRQLEKANGDKHPTGN